jgi:small-conductance mechanosensitive channel
MSLLDRCTLSFPPRSLSAYLAVRVYSRLAGKPGSRYGIMTAVSVFMADQRALV